MKVRQMRYFVEICKCENNITKAAENLHVTQPSVSIAIQEMEKELGYDLFIRSGKKLYLTKDGEYVLSHLSNLMEKMDATISQLIAYGEKHSTIRMGLPLHVGAYLMPIIFGEFYNKYPNIQIEIVEAGGLECIELVESGKIDLAVSIHGDYSFHDLMDIKLFDSEYCFCVNKHHSLASRQRISVLDIKDEPLVMLPNSFYINRYVTNLFIENGIQPHVLVYTKQLHTVKNLISNNIASAFLLKESVLFDENIVGIPIQEAETVTVNITVKKKKTFSAELQNLITFLCSKTYE